MAQVQDKPKDKPHESPEGAPNAMAGTLLAADPAQPRCMTYEDFLDRADEDTHTEWVDGKVSMPSQYAESGECATPVHREPTKSRAECPCLQAGG
jgi:hypothetical protein